MNYSLWTRYEPIMIRLVVQTTSPQEIVLKVYDPNQANTYFTDRQKNVNGVEELFIILSMSKPFFNKHLIIYYDPN